MKKPIKKKNNLGKSITKWSLSFLTLGGIVTGIFFGFSTSIEKGFQLDPYFQNKYSVQVEVERVSNDGTSIEDIARSIDERLNFIGYGASKVNTINRNNLEIILYPKTMNDPNLEIFSFENEKELATEILQVSQAALGKYYLDIRTPGGYQMFTKNANGDIIFSQPPEETPPPDFKQNKNVEDTVIPEDPYKIQLIAPSSASVSYVNGFPAINFKPASGVWSQFSAANDWLIGNEGSEGANYIAWFGYETLYYIANKLDPTGLASAGGHDALFTYCHTNSLGETSETIRDICQPFLIGTGQATAPLNIWKPNLEANLGITLTETKEAVNRLNFSTTKYSFNIVATSYQPTPNNSISILWAMVAFLILTALAIFSFTWYFGLLGLIASIGLGLSAIVPTIIMVSFGIALTPTVLFGIITITTLLLMILFTSLRIIQSSLKEDLSSKKALQNFFPKIFSKNIALIGIFLTVFLMFALFSSPTFQLSIYFIVFTGMITFLINLFFLSLFSFLYIWAFEIRNLKTWRGKWNYKVGYLIRPSLGISIQKTSGEFLKKTTKKSTVKLVTILGVFLIIISWGIFGVLATTTGHGFNLKTQDNNYYKYDIALVDWFDTNITDPNVPPSDPYDQVEMIAQATIDGQEIVNVVENYISIESWTITRQDELLVTKIIHPDDGLSDEESEYKISYGISIFSNDALSYGEVVAINNLIDTIGPVNGYVFQETYSLTNIAITQNSVELSAITVEDTQFVSIFGLIAMIVVAFVLMSIIYKISFGISFFLTSTFEILLTAGLLSLMFLPVSGILFFALSLVFLASLISKTLINKNVRAELKLNGEKHPNTLKHAITNGVKKSVLPSISFIVLFMGIGAMFSLLFGWVFLTFLIVTLIGSIIILIVNFTIYPWLLEKTETKLINYKSDLKQADMNKSKDKSSIEEEYIEGVNY